MRKTAYQPLASGELSGEPNYFCEVSDSMTLPQAGVFLAIAVTFAKKRNAGCGRVAWPLRAILSP